MTQRRPRLSAVALLLMALAIWGAGCAAQSGGEAEPGPAGRAGGRTARGRPPQAREAWSQYDLNGDGKITRGEFMAVRATCFARYDANGDGMLTRSEVRQLLRGDLTEAIQTEFTRLDRDGDGQVSREEFDRESDRLFRQLDTNGDGVIAGTERTSVTPAVLGELCAVGGSRSTGTHRTGERRTPSGTPPGP